MSLRVLATVLGVAAMLGLAGLASAQDKAGSTSTPEKAKSAPAKPGAAKDKTAAAKEKTGAAKAKTKGKAAVDTEKASESDNTNAQKPDAEKSDATKSEGATAEKAKKEKPKTEKATFGGGCFWCLEAVYERIKGVKAVVSGYAGGTVPRPSYEMVGTGLTGHAEVVQIEYDPEVISYDKLLQVFWICHNPTTLNRQGPDFGTQYRSIILYHNDEQKAAAKKSYEELTASGHYSDPIVTELAPLKAFYPAEAYHQNYYRRHRGAPYCEVEITPKLRKLHLLK